MKKLSETISISWGLYTSLMYCKLNYFWSSNPYIIFTYFSLFWFSPSLLFRYHSHFLSVCINSIHCFHTVSAFQSVPCHYIIMTSYYIIWRHIISHYVIHLIYAIPKIYNNQLPTTISHVSIIYPLYQCVSVIHSL